MRASNTFAILFWAYSSRAKNNLTGMYVRITVNGKKANISLKQQVDIRTWNSKRQRAKGNSETSRALNSYLDQVHSQLVKLYQDFKFKGELITSELIKAEYLGESDNLDRTVIVSRFQRIKVSTAITLLKTLL